MLIKSFFVERDEHEFPLMVLQATVVRTGRLLEMAVIDPDDYEDQ